MNKYRAKKRFGQHFLTDNGIIADIIASADLKDGDIVWEIGPGQGALTDSLVEHNIDLTIFEIDNDLIASLQKKYGGKCRIVHKDVLRVDWSAEIGIVSQHPTPNTQHQTPNTKHQTPIKIVTNLPYQISSPFLYKLTENHSAFECVVVMLQKEVAQRLCAKPGKKDYGVLTLKTQYYFEPTYLFDVSADKFSPPPEVASAVIKLVPRKVKPEIDDIDLFWKIVEAAFKHRRKTLRNNLLNIPIAHRHGIWHYLEYYNSLKNVPIDLSRRGETLSEDEFILLYKHIVMK